MKNRVIMPVTAILIFATIGGHLTGTLPGRAAADDLSQLKTVAEKSDFTATSLHAEVLEYQKQLATASHVENREIGKTVNGRSMLATIVAKPRYKFGDTRDPRLVILLLGNIHSGECAGKEGLLMLLRELAANPEHDWLKQSVVVCLPNYNADGNDRIGRNEIHRPGQVGPRAGMGLRENAQQLDLNRDFMKLESPEARALVGLMARINPHLFIDCHTTNGSRHRYHLTYDIPHNPTSPASLRKYMRQRMMPAVTKDLEKRKIDTFYYGNFSRDQTRWTTYGFEPRYSTEYFGLRGRLAILSEAYSYISYRDRVIASREFVRSCVDYVCDHAAEVRSLLKDIEKDSRSPGQELALQAEVRPFEKKFILKGYEGTTDQPADLEVEFHGNYVATRTRRIPAGYVLGPEQGRAVDRLLMHGISVSRIEEKRQLAVDRFRIDQFEQGREFQKHRMVRLGGSWAEMELQLEPGDYFVSTRQPLGRLAAYLLEPESNDGLVTWNFFDPDIDVGKFFPVAAVRETPTRLKMRPVSEVPPERLLTLRELYGLSGAVNFDGNTKPDLKWVSDTQYRGTWNGRAVLVDAATGGLQRVQVLSARLISSRLQSAANLDRELADRVAAGERIEVDSGIVLSAVNDLFWVSSTGDQARRLTFDRQAEELVTPSPDKRWIAFVKANDLYKIRLADGQVIRLTQTGSRNLLHGKLDWIYQEELYGRGNFRGYWWSPDSKSIAFLSLDESRVPRYQVTDHIPVRQRHEIYPYPKAGDPNPSVSLSVDGQTVDLAGFKIDQPLISRVCWGPDGCVYFQLQNRIQNQINLVKWKPGDKPTVLVHEKVDRGWLESPGNPVFVRNREGFIWFTHRSGRRHIATYSANGKIVEPGQGWTHRVADPIEVRKLIGANSEAVFFLAANPADVTRWQLYRLDSTGKSTAVTDPRLDHSIEASPGMSFFLDYRGSVQQPTCVALIKNDGSFVRYVEPNLVDQLDYYKMVPPVFQKVPTRDGDQMDSMLILPPDFDESKKYPVLMHVYSGPQAPRVRNRWGGNSYLWHQLLAQKGIVVWMCDNRSATHRGMDTAYPIYRDLGRRELMDIEDSLKWLKKKSWVDAERIGIWGWSYGGYMTGYAMTHSKSFKMGISGAPVTDWRNYDSIYTERYMGLPQDNTVGYDSSSVVKAAAKLHGDILIIHGTQDENVHIANTLQWVRELQHAGKQFRLMIYPKNRHGIRVPQQTYHLRQMMTDFVLEKLVPTGD